MEELVLLLGRALLLAIGVLLSLALLTANRSKSRLGVAGLAAGLAVTAVGYALARPLDGDPTSFLFGFAALAAAWGATWLGSHWKAPTAVFATFGVVYPTIQASGGSLDLPYFATFTASILAPTTALALVAATLMGIELIPRSRAIVASLALLAVLGAFRQLLADWSTMGFDSARLLVDLAPGLCAFALLGLSMLRLPRNAFLALSAVMVVAAAAPGVMPALLPPPPMPELVSEEEVRRAQFAGLIAMDAEEGAGPKPQFRNKTFEECDAIGSRDCFITLYDEIAMKKGVLAAVTDLLDKVKNGTGTTFPAHCHQTVHNLGQLSFEVIDNFSGASAVDPQVCATGFTHGLWEQEFTFLGPEVLFTRTSNLCRVLIPISDWYQWSCSHILGHALVTNMMDDPTRATEYCGTITDYNDRFNCAVGGWMNYFTDGTVTSTFVDYGSVREAFSVCYGAQEGILKYLCYQELFPIVYFLLGNSDYLAGQACLTLSEPTLRPNEDPWSPNSNNYAARCIYGLGRGVAVLAQYDYRLATIHCQAMPAAAVDNCLASAASGVTLNTGSVEAANRMCRAVNDERIRVYCYQWAKSTRALLENGPNVTNLPGPGEVRLPGQFRGF